MEVYQRTKDKVKEMVSIIDVEGLVKKASEGLLSLSVGLGLEVMGQLLEKEVEAYAGVKGKHEPDRKAYRHGTEKTKVVMGGQKMAAQRPRVRSLETNGELPLKVLSEFQKEDPLNEAILMRLIAGVSCRKYERTLEEKGETSSCTSKSEISRRFISGMKASMEEFFSRRLEGSYPAILMDGMGLGKMTVIAAMGIRQDGSKQMLGLIEGGTENTQVVKALLEDLIERGLDTNEARLYVLDGGKALAKAVKDTFGEKALVQRCQVHKKRNVLSHVPESEKSDISRRMTEAYQEFEFKEALRKLERIGTRLEYRYPAAQASLYEGLEETLTVHRLKVPGLLRQTLSNTNAMESANSVCAGIIRRVTHFKTGEIALRQAAAGFMEAERSFRRIKGYREIPILQNEINILTNTIIHDTIEIA